MRFNHRVLPDGCIDIIFDLSPYKNPSGKIVGTMTKPLLFQNEGPVQLVAVRFLPGGAVPFLRLAACEITDKQCPLPEIWQADGLAEQIGEESTLAGKIGRLELAVAETFV